MSFDCLRFMLAIVLAMCSAFHDAAQPLPKTIGDDPRDLDRIAHILQMTDVQRELMAELHREYLKRCEQEAWPHVRAYGGSLKNAQDARTSVVEGIALGTLALDDIPNLVPAFENACSQLPRAYEAVEALDTWFFDQLALLLTDPQSILLEHARLFRERTLYRHITLPEANLDLVEIVISMESTIPPDRRGAIHAWKLEYGRLLAALLKRGIDEWSRWRVLWHEGEQFALMAKADSALAHKAGFTVPLTERRKQWLHAQADCAARAGRMAAGPATELTMLNRAHLAHLEQLLGSENGDLLKQRYFENAYPGIDPDHGSAIPLFEAVLQREDLSNDQRTAVTDLANGYGAQHERLSAQMRTSTFERNLAQLRQEAGPDVSRKDRWAEIREIADRRHALNRAQRPLLMGILTAEQLLALPSGPWEYTDPPRPWDPLDQRRRNRDR